MYTPEEAIRHIRSEIQPYIYQKAKIHGAIKFALEVDPNNLSNFKCIYYPTKEQKVLLKILDDLIEYTIARIIQNTHPNDGLLIINHNGGI